MIQRQGSLGGGLRILPPTLTYGTATMFHALPKAPSVHDRSDAAFQLLILYPTLSNTGGPATCGYGALKHG